jgi:hypothetical protein
MVCLGNICINTLHKGAKFDDDDDDEDNNNNNNNNNNELPFKVSVSTSKSPALFWASRREIGPA